MATSLAPIVKHDSGKVQALNIKENNDIEVYDDVNRHLIDSRDPFAPANQLPTLCALFYTLGWVPGTGGGASIRDGDLVYLAPSGVEKERMRPEDIYVLSLSAQQDPKNRVYLRQPDKLKPSQCTPLFLACFTKRNAGCCIHTHSQWAVLMSLLLESDSKYSSTRNAFEINNLEQIKGFKKGPQKEGNLGFHDTLRIPVIENTPQEEDLVGELERVLQEWPDTYAILVRRHGLYVWGDTVVKAKTMAESYDYIFQLAVEMHKLGLPWVSDIPHSV